MSSVSKIERIPRFNAKVDGETIMLIDSPTGTVINTTLLLSVIQRRIPDLWRAYKEERDSEEAHIIYGRIEELTSILDSLGEKPL